MKNDYNSSFLKELSKLNPEQSAAVKQIEGPVLVIAGPGTGKTQILSARIGKILSDTDANPHNILCLTYTDAGVVAMRKRLLSFIGPDAYRVNIFTFHAFCNKVIQDNLDVFGIRGLQAISDLEKKQLFETLIDSFTPSHPLKRFTGEVYYEAGRLENFFSIMKKEGWSSVYLTKAIDEYIDSLPDREGYRYVKANLKLGVKVGDLKQKIIDEEIDKMNKAKAAAQEFDRFEALMKKERRYDYDDMIIWVLDAFRSNPSLLASYQERYQYILVDEYQDTNGSQNQIIHLLASYWENPNLFAVGDDDQSIYRFQGANMKNILDFHVQYADSIQVVVLKKNYRSTQSILDASKTLIENNKERLTNNLPNLDKNLISGNLNYENNTVVPHVTEYYNVRHEELAVLLKIQDLVAQGESLQEISVIYRNHKQVANIVKLLQKNAIPLTIRKKTNILELKLVQNLLMLFRYIQAELERPDSGHYLLYQLMHIEFFELQHHDINAICRACNVRENNESTSRSWRLLMQSNERLFSLGLQSSKAVTALESNLSYWIKESVNLTLQGLFEKIVTRGGLLTWVLNSPDRIWLMQVVTSFFDFIKNESAKKSNYSLTDFLSTIDLMQKYSLSIDLDKSIVSEAGVNFMTAHSSKGLEFKHVFLIGANRSQWEGKSARASTFKIPDTVIESVLDTKIEEERRLFYVAMTRAKEYLYISYSGMDENSKPLESSQFVAEVLEDTALQKKTVHLSDDVLVDFQADCILEVEMPEIKLMDGEFLKEALKNYKLSVTHLNKYLDCPLRFYFENVIRVPSARSESMGFGSAVHYSLEYLFKTMLESPEKEFPSQDYFLDAFERSIKNYQSHFTEKQLKAKMEYGREMLPKFYSTYKNGWNKEVLIEYPIDGVEFEGIPITGKLDKLEFEGASVVNVIDYKTGKAENGKKKLQPPSEKDPLGGDYWRQIVFYKILLDSDRKRTLTMVSGELDFVEPTKSGTFVREKVVVDPESLNTVKDQVRDTYQRIMNFEFSKGCGKEDCQWCSFVKQNYRGVDLQMDTEEE